MLKEPFFILGGRRRSLLLRGAELKVISILHSVPRRGQVDNRFKFYLRNVSVRVFRTLIRADEYGEVEPRSSPDSRPPKVERFL